MNVKELVIELLDYDADETVYVSLDKDRISRDISIENWHGTPIIHFEDWRKSDIK